MKTKSIKKRSNLLKLLVYFSDAGYDIMYVTLIIVSIIILSRAFPEKQTTYSSILGVHLLSLYIPYLIKNVLVKMESYLIKRSKKTLIELKSANIPEATLVIVINAILIVIAGALDALITILVIVGAEVIARFIFAIMETLPIEEDENGTAYKIIALLSRTFPFVIIIVALFLSNWAIALKMLFFVGYCIITLVISLIVENVIDLGEILDDVFREIFN